MMKLEKLCNLDRMKRLFQCWVNQKDTLNMIEMKNHSQS